MSQTYKNHGYLPVPTVMGFACLMVAVTGFALRWNEVGGRTSFAIGLAGLVAATAVLLSISRVYTTKLQDRIIRLEMRVRGASLLTPEQQRLLASVTIKQMVALRFASDAELPALLERTAREQLKPAEIKRAITSWTPDHDRT